MKNHQYKEHTWLEGMLALTAVAMAVLLLLVVGVVDAQRLGGYGSSRNPSLSKRWSDTLPCYQPWCVPGHKFAPQRPHSKAPQELAATDAGCAHWAQKRDVLADGTVVYRWYCVSYNNGTGTQTPRQAPPGRRYPPRRYGEVLSGKVGLASPLMYCGKWVTVSQSYACGDNVCVRRVRKCAGGAYGQGRQQYGEYRFRR